MKLAFSSLASFLSISLMLIIINPVEASADLTNFYVKRSDVSVSTANDDASAALVKRHGPRGGRGPPRPPGRHHKRSLDFEEGKVEMVKRTSHAAVSFGSHPTRAGHTGGAHSLPQGSFHGPSSVNKKPELDESTISLNKRHFPLGLPDIPWLGGPGPFKKRDVQADQIDVQLQKRCGGGGGMGTPPQRRGLTDQIDDVQFQKRCGGGGGMGAPPQKRDVQEDFSDVQLQKRCGGGGGMGAPPQKRDLDDNLDDVQLQKRCGGGMGGPPGPQKRSLESQENENGLKKRGSPMGPPPGGFPMGPPPGMPFRPPFGGPPPMFMGHPPMGGPPMGGPPTGGPPPQMGGGGDAGGGDGGDAGARKRDLDSELDDNAMVKRGIDEVGQDDTTFEKRHRGGDTFQPGFYGP